MRTNKHSSRGRHLAVQAGGNTKAWGAGTIEGEERRSRKLSIGAVVTVQITTLEITLGAARIPRSAGRP